MVRGPDRCGHPGRRLGAGPGSGRLPAILGDVPAPQILIQSPDSSTGWWRAPKPERLLIADSLDKVNPVLDEVDAWTQRDGWAVGFVTYEAGPAFEPALAVHSGSSEVDPLPLAWFALCEAPIETPAPTRQTIDPVAWEQVLERRGYVDKLATIHVQIAAGNTYQVNFTVPLRTGDSPDPEVWFGATFSRAPQACQAWIEVPAVGGRGPWSIVSLSPELFFELDGRMIRSRPMKGTSRPGRDLFESRDRAAALARSEKDRAENVMIVDMVRNDLGRIADTGSVEVPSLFKVEHHPTVLQMTSTVEAETDASLTEIFAALFPCASITGAPKIATSRIIADLELQPRGVYTGAIGWAGPGRRSRFGVAIRTAVVDHRHDIAEYGIGSGVVWDSDPELEYQECAAKAAIISRPRVEYELLETMLWEPSRGLVLAEAHKRRLLASARHFGQPLEEAAVDAALEDVGEGPCAPPAARNAEIENERLNWPKRIRLIASPEREVVVETTDLEPLPSPLRVTFAELDVPADDPRLWHKTTARKIYERALADHPEADEVLLINSAGEVTEATRANLVLEVDGKWLTPRRQAGLLNGTLRSELLESGVIEEATVTPEMVRSSDALYLINSVRGWIPVALTCQR